MNFNTHRDAPYEVLADTIFDEKGQPVGGAMVEAEGDCPGTIPKCKEELKMLTEQLQTRKKMGLSERFQNRNCHP